MGTNLDNPKKGKPQSKWHNFKILAEKKLGPTECAISLSPKMTAKLIIFLVKRLVRGCGARFKFIGYGAEEIVEKDGTDFMCWQCYTDQDPFIFPEESPHTNEYNSPYSRIEIYSPMERYARKKSQNTP